MAPFDRLHMTFYWSAAITIALPCTIFELSLVTVLAIIDRLLVTIIWVRGHSRSLQLVPFASLDAVSYSPSIVTIAVSCIACEI